MGMSFFLWAWWVLTNGIMHYASLRFLAAFRRAPEHPESRRPCPRGYAALWLVMNGCLTLANAAFHIGGAWALYGILLAGFSRFALNLRWRASLAPVALVLALYTFTESISTLVMYWISSNLNSAEAGQILQLLLSAAMDVLYVFSLRRMERQLTFRDTSLPQLCRLLAPWACFVLPIRFALRLDTLGFEQFLRAAGLSVSFTLLGMILGGTAVFVLLVRLFYRNLRLEEGREAALRLQERAAGQERCLAKVRKENEQYAAFQHDIRNHLLVLSELVRTEHYEEALGYAGKLHAGGAFRSLGISTGSPAVDGLLEEKLGYAESRGIRTACRVELPGKFSSRDTELCAILSNLADNGIRACMEEQEGRPFLSISARPRGGVLLIEVLNSSSACGPVQKGIGLSNVERIAEDWGGAVELENRDGIFRISVLLCSSQKI